MANIAKGRPFYKYRYNPCTGVPSNIKCIAMRIEDVAFAISSRHVGGDAGPNLNLSINANMVAYIFLTYQGGKLEYISRFSLKNYRIHVRVCGIRTTQILLSVAWLSHIPCWSYHFSDQFSYLIPGEIRASRCVRGV